ncbi:hypothetical protein Ancab_033641 [Ancistrocladus abbreviatus]
MLQGRQWPSQLYLEALGCVKIKGRLRNQVEITKAQTPAFSESSQQKIPKYFVEKIRAIRGKRVKFELVLTAVSASVIMVSCFIHKVTCRIWRTELWKKFEDLFTYKQFIGCRRELMPRAEPPSAKSQKTMASVCCSHGSARVGILGEGLGWGKAAGAVGELGKGSGAGWWGGDSSLLWVAQPGGRRRV